MVVGGARRVALINLKRRTLVRLANGAWRNVLAGGDAGSAKIRARLVEQDYLESGTDARDDALPDRATICIAPPAKTLVLSDRLSGNRGALEVVRQFVEGGHTSHVVALQEPGQATAGLASAFLPSLGVPYEVGVAHGEHLETLIFTRTGQQAGARRTDFQGARKIAKRLRLTYRGVLMNTMKHEGYGFLYVDENAVVWPDWLEPRVNFGELATFGREGSPDRTNQAFDEYSTNHKGKRNLCMACELRTCCTWSASQRVDPRDIRSAPSGCGYDPMSEDFQNGKF
jgi:hypothetical protein